jgi:hypothetical protein
MGSSRLESAQSRLKPRPFRPRVLPTFNTVGFPRGQLVLKAQSHILPSLQHIVLKILRPTDTGAAPKTEVWESLNSNRQFQMSGNFNTDGTLSPFLAPGFSPPPRLDLDQVIELARSQKAAAEDHVWEMQCSPRYLKQQMQMWADGLGAWRNTTRELSEELRTSEFNLFKTDITDASALVTQDKKIIDDIDKAFWWRWIEDECRHAKAMQVEHQDAIRNGMPLPLPYEKAIAALELCLTKSLESSCTALEVWVREAPQFAHNFEYHLTESAPGELPRRKDIFTGPTRYSQAKKHDALLFALMRIQDCRASVFGDPDFALPLAFIQELCAAEPKRRARLDSAANGLLANIAAKAAIVSAIQLARPRSRLDAIEDVMETGSGRCYWRAFKVYQDGPTLDDSGVPDGWTGEDKLLAMMNSVRHVDEFRSLVSAKSYFHGKPIISSRQARAKAMREAVEKMWPPFRVRHACFLAAAKFTEEEIASHMALLSASETDEYARIVQQENARFATRDDGGESPYVASFPTGHVKDLAVRMPRVAAATDGLASLSVDDESSTAPAKTNIPNPVRPLLVIWLKHKSSLHVFELMFRETNDADSDSEASGGMVHWRDFRQAMADAGFGARNGGGSEVSFAPLNGGGGRIVFHRPHPVPKIDPVMLSAMGKRMAKWFSWSLERLTLEKKG